jgi:hypothetical protein
MDPAILKENFDGKIGSEIVLKEPYKFENEAEIDCRSPHNAFLLNETATSVPQSGLGNCIQIEGIRSTEDLNPTPIESSKKPDDQFSLFRVTGNRSEKVSC